MSKLASNMAAKRIKKEIADLAKENLGNITLAPVESNIYLWKATLPGPAGSPYEGGVFDVDIRVPEDYPFSPPKLQFMTKVYHCNINSSGGICLDLLKNAWSPALSLYKVILSLSSLLTDPNPSDPLVPNIAQEYNRNRKKHDATAREWTQLYALPKAPAPIASSSKTTASRPALNTAHSSSRAIPRAVPSTSTSSVPPAQVTGKRRANGTTSSREPIELVDSDEDDSSGVEVVGSTNRAGPKVNGSNGNGPIDVEGSSTIENGRSRSTRASKRARLGTGVNGSTSTAAGESSSRPGDDVIIIDE